MEKDAKRRNERIMITATAVAAAAAYKMLWPMCIYYCILCIAIGNCFRLNGKNHEPFASDSLSWANAICGECETCAHAFHYKFVDDRNFLLHLLCACTVHIHMWVQWKIGNWIRLLPFDSFFKVYFAKTQIRGGIWKSRKKKLAAKFWFIPGFFPKKIKIRKMKNKIMNWTEIMDWNNELVFVFLFCFGFF